MCGGGSIGTGRARVRGAKEVLGEARLLVGGMGVLQIGEEWLLFGKACVDFLGGNDDSRCWGEGGVPANW